MLPGSLSFAAREWIWPATVLFLAGVFLVVRSYSHTGLSGPARWVSIALKIFGIALVLSILLEPTWTTTRPREGANLFAVLAELGSASPYDGRGVKPCRSAGLAQSPRDRMFALQQDAAR